MGGGSDSRSNSNSVSRVDDLQSDYLERLYNYALGNVSGVDIRDGSGRSYGGKLDYYPDQTIAPQSAMTRRSYAEVQNLLDSNGGPSATQGEQYNQSVLRGDFLNSNPYIDRLYENASKGVTDAYNRSVIPSVQTRFGTSGNSMSAGRSAAIGQAQDVLGDQLRRLSTDIYGGQYAREREMQDVAADRAPSYERAARERIGAVAGAGQDEFNYRQSVLDADIDRFEFNRDEPFTRLSRFSSLIGQPVITNESSTRSKSSDTQGAFGIIGRLLGF